MRASIAWCGALVLSCVLGGGCASSPWKDSLVRGPDAAEGTGERGAPVRVQSVPWERVEKTLGELRQDVVNSDTHPDDWSSEQRVAAKGKLLRGLQVQGEPSSVRLLGKSEFRTLNSLNTNKDLEAVARSLGADTVVYSTRLLGKGTKVVDQPVTSFTSGTFWERDSDGRHRPQSYSESNTTWIPIVVQADEVAAVAFYLRTGRAYSAR